VSRLVRSKGFRNNNMVRLNSSRGFTLIELLVVIAIIGLLSSVVLASLNSARGKGRDARRKADLQQIRNALELYASDHNGQYPCEVASKCTGQSVNANGKIGEGSGLDTLLAPYFPTIPHDPAGPGDANYYYYYDGAQVCTGKPNIIVVFARNLESSAGNGSDFCSSWGGEGVPVAPTHGILLLTIVGGSTHWYSFASSMV